MQARGMKSKVLIGFEDSYGTKQTAAGKVYQLPFNSFSLKASQSFITSNTITGTRNPVEPANGQKDVSGSGTFPLEARSIGYLLKGLFGAPTTTAVTDKTGMYQHVFKLTDSQPSMTVEKGFSDIGKYELFTGVKISKLDFDAEVGNNETTVKAEMAGKSGAPQSSSISATAAMLDIKRFQNTGATVKQDGAVLATSRKMSISIDAGLDTDTFCLNGTAERTDIAEGVMSISVDLTTLFTDTDEMQKAIDGTPVSLELLYQTGDFSLSILLPEVKLEQTSPEISGPKGITLDMKGQAYYGSSTQKSAAVVTLINDVKGY